MPTPERYREIQEALVAKGYLGAAGGAWNQESTDALRRFQQDQNLKADGKLDALTLIALGLGPRRDTSSLAKPEMPSPSLSNPTTRTPEQP
jgi:peptidoglycan hydrolase-like protein with peptidoglycan-binding domain